MSRTFAYCRVSTQTQTTENQVLEIASAGFSVAARHVYSESISGKIPALDRPEFKRMYEKLDEGDVLIVTKLDRLGRNTSDVLATVAMLAQVGVKVHCLALGGLDLTSAAGKMTMGVLSAVAEFERDLLVERTQAGLERAKAEGKKLGRKISYTDEQAQQIRKNVGDGVWSIRVAAKECGLSAGAVQRILAANTSTAAEHV